VLKLTYSEQPTEPSKPTKQNTLLFQVLFVFSLCVLSYVIIQKSTDQERVTDVPTIETAAVSQIEEKSLPDTTSVDDEAVAQDSDEGSAVIFQENETTQTTQTTSTNTESVKNNFVQNAATQQPITSESVDEVDEEPEQVEDQTYTVKRGDVLGVISQKVYGSVKHINLIVKANPELIDPDVLREGMVLTIPAMKVEASRRDDVDTTVSISSDYKFHEVKQGDTIWDICEKYYGSGSKQSWIKEDNPQVFASNKDLLKIGAKLKIRTNP